MTFEDAHKHLFCVHECRFHKTEYQNICYFETSSYRNPTVSSPCFGKVIIPPTRHLLISSPVEADAQSLGVVLR